MTTAHPPTHTSYSTAAFDMHARSGTGHAKQAKSWPDPPVGHASTAGVHRLSDRGPPGCWPPFGVPAAASAAGCCAANMALCSARAAASSSASVGDMAAAAGFSSLLLRGRAMGVLAAAACAVAAGVFAAGGVVFSGRGGSLGPASPGICDVGTTRLPGAWPAESAIGLSSDRCC